MSFAIAQENGRADRVVLSVTGAIHPEDGAELFERIRAALDAYPEVALDLRQCVFVDPSHLTSVLRLRRRRNGSQRLSLVSAGIAGGAR